MRSLRFLSCSVLAVGLGLAGCGGSDGSSGDAGVDAGAPEPAVCPSGECNLVDQDCGEGLGCYFAETGDGGDPSPVCAPTPDQDGAEGDPCMDANDCQEGLLCIGPTGMAGTCRTVCCIGEDGGCTGDESCLIPVAAPGPGDTGVGACAVGDACDLLEQDCGEGEGCYPSVQPGVTVCIAGGELQEGAPCDFANDCAPGLACTEGECTKLCDRTDDSGCTISSQDCVTLVGFDAPVGVCDPPVTD
ncbi:MAG: hypothetical protein ACODAU_09925 [Myxococcota bacterium]